MMSDFNSRDEDGRYQQLRSDFQKLQALVVSTKNTVAILKDTASLATIRLRTAEEKLKREEVELAHLHRLLRPNDE